MKHVKKSVLLSYSAHEMYSLVVAVADYPKFLPWCSQADIVERREDGMTAKLYLAIAGMRQAFTTRNTHVPDRSVSLRLVDGPFTTMDGDWTFTPLGTGDACKVELSMRYEFSNAAFELVLSPVFDRVANTLVDSFVKRAAQVYGDR